MDQIGVIQLPHHRDFAFKPNPDRGVAQAIRPNHLDRRRAIEAEVITAIDLSHTTATKQLQQLVIAQDSSLKSHLACFGATFTMNLAEASFHFIRQFRMIAAEDFDINLFTSFEPVFPIREQIQEKFLAIRSR